MNYKFILTWRRRCLQNTPDSGLFRAGGDFRFCDGVFMPFADYNGVLGLVSPIERIEDGMLTNRREIYIEWGDCDPGGIVYFPRYFEYCDCCTNRLFELAGLHKPEMMKTYGIAGIPLVDARAQFFAPSVYGETVVVESCIKEWGRSSFTVRHRLYKGDVLAVEVFEKRVWVVSLESDASRFKGHPIPQQVKDRFKAESPKRQA